jgi:anhydro-N-acetylmuramic acid kinase
MSRPSKVPGKRSSLLALGLMSGTSADGIDVALVRIAGRPPGLRTRLEGFADFPYPAEVRAAILRVAEGQPTTTGEISQLNVLIGELFARAALSACRRFKINAARIALIGSHGQTIFHQGTPGRFLGSHRVASTLQIGEPAVIAARAGITTVGDFRPADMAAGGQGAPLVPFVDYLLYRDARRGRVALNIGGIANLTAIPAGAAPRDVFAFDTGPGNMVIDALVHHFTHGRQTFDRDARMARRGSLLPELLATLLGEEFFGRRPPKTAGREQYGREFVSRILAWGRKHRARPESLVRTATIFTALSILDALHRWVRPRARVHDLIVSGGGSHNPLLLGQIAAGLQGVKVVPSSAFGVPEDAKEAFAFAVLAHETYQGRPANIPRATGAKAPAILGKVCFPG